MPRKKKNENKVSVFEEAFKKLIKKEAGYSNIKEDRGGETYKGIARNFYPMWEGWKIIDELKNDLNISTEKLTQKDIKKLNSELEKNNDLQEKVKEFYKTLYWDRMHADEFDPEISTKLFTFSVNSGSAKTAIKYLQQSLNYLNRNGKEYPDLVEDGIYGAKTRRAYGIIKKSKMIDILLEVIKCLQCRHYLNLMDKNKEYEEFRGWFRRIKD